MGRSRPVGTVGTRIETRGRAPQSIGVPQGQGSNTRIIPGPPVTRIYTHCEANTKAGKPCQAPNVKGKAYCQGHLNQLAAKERAAS